VESGEEMKNVANDWKIFEEDITEEVNHGIRVSNLAYYVARELGLYENTCHELAVAGMLHDIYTYANMDSTEHGPKGAELARQLLDSLRLFSEKEQELICSAIFHHSDKAVIHGPLDELLKDADVMQHVLHQPLCAIAPHEQQRFEALKAELGIQS